MSIKIIAQNIKNIKGAESSRVEKNESRENAEKRICDAARNKALEEEFGRYSIQGNTTRIENIQSGTEIQSSSMFTLIADSYIKGIWVQDTKAPIISQDMQSKTGEIWLTCQVQGKGKELTAERLDMYIEALDCESLPCKTNQYTSGEAFYLYFKTPKNGYVVVFLDDGKETFCIYPYQNMPYNEFANFEFQAQKEYVFFSEKKRFRETWNFVDQLVLETTQKAEQNRLYIVFSPGKINLPVLDKSTSTDKDGLFIPRSLDSEKFRIWLAKRRSLDDQLQLDVVDVLIKK